MTEGVLQAALRALDGFAERRVLVLGEAMLDSYLFGDSTRLCQEAPVPVVALRERQDRPGGAANTAVNLAALGCQVELLSVVGDDHEGRRVRELLAQLGVGSEMVRVQAGRRTLAKHRVMNGDRLVVRFDQGDTGPIHPDVERALIDRLEETFPRFDAIVVSDYGYGVVTDSMVIRLTQLQSRLGRLIAVDARDLPRYRAVGITVVKPNYEEAVRLAGMSIVREARSRADSMCVAGELILERIGARITAITLDTDGAVIVERGRPAYRTFAEPADHTRAAGAGDTYLGAFSLALATGASTPAAAEIAGAAAAVVVSRTGTAACTADELRAALRAARPPRPTTLDEAEERDGRDELGDRRTPALHQA